MTNEELEKLAASGGELPSDIGMNQKILYIALRLLYRTYKQGIITREQASAEKRKIYDSYELLMLDFRILEKTKKTRERLIKDSDRLRNCGCEHCKELLDIFYGLIR